MHLQMLYGIVIANFKRVQVCRFSGGQREVLNASGIERNRQLSTFLFSLSFSKTFISAFILSASLLFYGWTGSSLLRQDTHFTVSSGKHRRRDDIMTSSFTFTFVLNLAPGPIESRFLQVATSNTNVEVAAEHGLKPRLTRATRVEVGYFHGWFNHLIRYEAYDKH